MKVTVLGAGSWGTALSLTLARAGHDVRLLGREDEALEQLLGVRENLRYLPGFVLPENVSFGTLDQGVAADIIVVAVPSIAIRDVLPFMGHAPIICVASKGLDSNGSVLADVVQEAHPNAQIAAISGPNLATELARGIPTAAVAASACEETALKVRDAFNGRTFRVYITDDVRGVEFGGALKNVMAIGAGMADGLGFGDNTKGALLSRGLSEIARLGIASGAKLETFLGLAGVGDLFATAASRLSRNYRVGYGLGEGRALDEILDEIGQVAEGVPTTDAAVRLARSKGVEVRIMEQIQMVLQGHMQAREAVGRLMERSTLHEGLGYVFHHQENP
jgi:glycerol-3-phosphate dehydrogenase (NAD(P)+)